MVVADRVRYLDDLKVLLIAAIIAIHGVASYSSLDIWTYGVVREATLAPLTELAFVLVVGPFGLFLIALLFLVAGLLTPGSAERKGVRRFVGDRLLRLGIPFAVYVALIQPAVTYALYQPLGHETGSYWDELVSAEGSIDTGPLWFVGVLLIFSLAYAAWLALRGSRPTWTGPVRAGHLAALVTVIAPLTFLIRLVYPFGTEAGFSDLNLWQWPGCLGVFVLGILTADQGWISQVPDELVRRSRTVLVVTVPPLAALAVTAALQDRVDDVGGGWNPFAVGFVILESVLTVFGPVWALGVAQRRLGAGPARRGLAWGTDLGRAAYAAFILQTMVLVGLAAALRGVPLPAEVKALVVATGGVVGSFWLAALVLRVPVLRRVL